jgi:hypothetical protein
MSGPSAAARTLRPTRGAARGIAGVLRDTPAMGPRKYTASEFADHLLDNNGAVLFDEFDYGDFKSIVRGVNAPDSRQTVVMVDMNDVARALPTDDIAPYTPPGVKLKIPRAKLDIDSDTGDMVVRMPGEDMTAKAYQFKMYSENVYSALVPISLESPSALLPSIINTKSFSGMVRIEGAGGESVRVPLSRVRLPEELKRSIESRTDKFAQSKGWTEYELDYLDRHWRGVDHDPILHDYRFSLNAVNTINANRADPVAALAEVSRLPGFPDDLKVLSNKVGKAMRNMADQGFEFSVMVPPPNYNGGKLNTKYQGQDRVMGVASYKSSIGRVDIELRHPSRWDPKGTNAETMLHEYVHAATMTAIDHSGSSNAPLALRQAVDELETIRKIANIEFMNAQLGKPGVPLTDMELIGLRGTNAFDDVHELVAWGTTNPEMRSMLSKISAPGTVQTLWDRLVHAISRILGIDAPEKSALERVLIRTNELLDFAEDGGAFKLYEQDWLDTYGSIGGS